MADFTSDYLPKRRKRRRGFSVALIAILLIVGLVVAGLFYLGTLGIRVENNFQRGLIHFNEGKSLLKKAEAESGELGSLNATPDRSQSIARALKSVNRAERDFNLAEDDFKQMKKRAVFGWERETAALMMKSVGETTAAARGFKSEMKRVEDIADILNQVGQGADKFKQAIDKSNVLIALNNSGRYTDVKQAAPQVASLFKDARKLIALADKSTSKTGLASYENRISLGEELVSRLSLMADSGLSGNMAEYERIKNESNGILSQLVKTSQSEIITNPGAWAEAQFKQVFQEINVHIDKAEKFNKKALDLWAKNT